MLCQGLDVTRSWRYRTVGVGAVAIVALVTSCRSQRESDFGLIVAAPTPLPSELSCPSGNAVGTDGGLLAELPDGYDTRKEALATWLEHWPEWGRRYTIADDGTAWILRADGTARAHVTFIEHEGFTAQGYEECTD